MIAHESQQHPEGLMHMDREMAQTSPRRTKVAGSLLTGDQVKIKLHQQGDTLKAWAKRHGYPYGAVSNVVRGVNLGTYGLGHSIAVALGMKRG